VSDAPHRSPGPQRIAVDAEQVRRLVADQFPQWADLPVRTVADGGWDNWTFHLGSQRSVRLPSASEYSPGRDNPTDTRMAPHHNRQADILNCR
jgi:aminoglycoside phosphotransferase (APT) family kinase protein